MKNRFLLKSLILLFALVVGCSNVWADIVVTLDNIGAGLSGTANTTAATTSITATGTTTAYTLNYYQCKKQTSGSNYAMFMVKDVSAYISNKTAMPGNIKSVQVFIMSGAAGKTTYDCAFSTTECTSATSGIGAVNITGGNNHTFSNMTGTPPAINVKGKYFCITLGNSNNGQVLKLVITCEAYTITPAVNDALMGSASVSGTTITAAPNDGYRVISGTGGYTVTSGTATVVNNGDNTFTVTPSSDCTVQINFEAIPTHTLSSAIDPVVLPAAGTVTLGTTTIREGSTTTASAAAAAGYTFTGWSISGIGATLSSNTDNPTTITMGTADATVTANFEAATTHAITYNVNDVTTIVNVVEGESIDFSAPESSLIPIDNVFIGWRTSTLAETNTDPNDYVTSATSTADITYYAVFAIIASVTETKSQTLEYDTWSYTGSTTDKTSYRLFHTNSYIESATFDLSKLSKVIVKGGTFGGSSYNSLTIGDGTNTWKNVTVSGNSETGTNTYTGGTALTGTKKLRITSNSGTASGTGVRISKVEIYTNEPNYSSFRTSVSEVSLDDDVTISGDLDVTYSLTVQSNTILTVNGTLSIEGGGSITIEDGGQLITNSSVALTYNKNMKESDKAVNWYTIATPVHYKKDATDTDSIRVSDVTNLILDKDSYDFFYYDEYNSTLGGVYWMNYKASHPGFPFKVGQGFLYRNDGSKLSFAGTSNSAASYTYSLKYTGAAGDLAGINLIGNPYPHNITMDYVTVGDGTLAGGYVLSESDGWAAEVATTIAPTQGFLVQISTSGQTATIHKSEPDPGKSRANRDYIKFIVNNSNYEDATFALFDKCDGLNKIDHRNADIPMIYIPQDGQNFAIATMSDETQSFNLNFKAKTTGKYTLSYQTKGNYSYLHVIDRLTGEDIDMLLDGEYSFIASPQDNAARFIVKLSYNANGNNTNENDIFAFQSGSDIIVNGEGELQVFDVTGRQVMNTTINGMESIDIPAQGVYIFRLNEKVQKIVVR